MLQVDRHLFVADGVILGTGHLFYNVPAQRQRLGDCQASAVALDGIYKGIGLVINLKYRAFQRCASWETIDGIVVSGLLPNLDLGRDGGVLPFDFSGCPVPDVDGFQFVIHQIPLIFQLTDVVTPTGEVLYINIATVITDILSDWVPIAVIHQKVYAIDALASSRVNLVNEKTAESLIFNADGSCFPILHLKITRGII